MIDSSNPLTYSFFIWLFLIMLWLSFEVVRHGDCLAVLLVEPYGTLILRLSVISIGFIMIFVVMLTGENKPTPARETMFSVLIIVFSGKNDTLTQNQKGGMMPHSEGKPEKFSWITNKAFLSVFGALFALVFIALLILINVATQVEDIEEKLQYMPPQPKGSEISEESVIAGQTIYVPVYSHIYSQGGKPFLLEATLSVRNSDPDKKITIRSVRYYDTNGKLIKKYLERPLQIKPLATAEFLVKQKKIEGGSGANFIVEWVAKTKVNKPVIEAVMVGIEGQTSFSFVRPGAAIEN